MDILNHPHEIILNESQIKNRVIELGKQITSDYGSSDLLVICILKGSSVFFADLIRSINLPVIIDFIRISSYGNQTTSSGKCDIICDCTIPIKGKDILIVEDIIDTGATSKHLIEHLLLKNPCSVKICSLLNKKFARKPGNELKIDYIGFDIPNKFLIGYGLDYKEKFRNLPYIAAFMCD